MNEEALAIMTLIGTVAFILYLLISSRHKERLALLEYDRDASVFTPGRKKHASGALKFGLVFLFGGVGLILGYFVQRIFGLPEELATFSFLLIAGGGGLLTYYFLNQQQNEAE